MSHVSALKGHFCDMVRRSLVNYSAKYSDARQRYLKMSYELQNPCRMTLDTLATVKNRPTIVAKKANTSHGPRQENNDQASAPRNQVKARQHTLGAPHKRTLVSRLKGRQPLAIHRWKLWVRSTGYRTMRVMLTFSKVPTKAVPEEAATASATSPRLAFKPFESHSKSLIGNRTACHACTIVSEWFVCRMDPRTANLSTSRVCWCSMWPPLRNQVGREECKVH